MLLYEDTYARLIDTTVGSDASTHSARQHAVPVWTEGAATVCLPSMQHNLATMGRRFNLSRTVQTALAGGEVQIRHAKRVWLRNLPAAVVIDDQPDVVFRFPGIADRMLARIIDMFSVAETLWARVCLFKEYRAADEGVYSMGCRKVRLDTSSHTFIPMDHIESFVLLHHDCRFSPPAPAGVATCVPVTRRFSSDSRPRRILDHNAANPFYYVNRFVNGKRIGMEK